MSIPSDNLSTEETDYSSYKYQHAGWTHTETGDNGAASEIAVGVEPLESSGGLEINEVAELVSLRVVVDISGDDFAGIADTAQGHAQFRGVIGANLDSRSDTLQAGDRFNTITAGDSEVLFEGDGANPTGTLIGHDKSEVFYHFQVGNDTPFSSDAGGVGGGGGATSFMYETMNFRDMTGRGPVLDANDEITIISNLNKNQVSADAEGSVRWTAIWDIASVDDAGRRFSVPMDD